VDVIICSAQTLAEMHDHLKNEKKIAAIKALRAGAVPPPDHKSITLRDAKWAVERYQYEKLGQAKMKEAMSRGMPIVAGPLIKEIVVDFGTGPATLDVESMELKALSQLESIGLEACGRMLELCQVIKAFSDGKRVGVIDED